MLTPSKECVSHAYAFECGSMAAALQGGGKLTMNSRHWHHSPAHVFAPNTMYMITASTLHKEPIFQGPDRLGLLQRSLFMVVEKYAWKLQAWAIFPNHYHLVAQSSDDGASLKRMIQRLHSQSAREANFLDSAQGRKVWFQYWDTCLTYEKSYYVRLNYVHNNPVKHGLVELAEHYPYCSAGWFKTHAEPAFYRKVSSFRYDRIKVVDDF